MKPFILLASATLASLAQAHEEVVAAGFPQPAQRMAGGRLAEREPLRGRGDGP